MEPQSFGGGHYPLTAPMRFSLLSASRKWPSGSRRVIRGGLNEFAARAIRTRLRTAYVVGSEADPPVSLFWVRVPRQRQILAEARTRRQRSRVQLPPWENASSPCSSEVRALPPIPRKRNELRGPVRFRAVGVRRPSPRLETNRWCTEHSHSTQRPVKGR